MKGTRVTVRGIRAAMAVLGLAGAAWACPPGSDADSLQGTPPSETTDQYPPPPVPVAAADDVNILSVKDAEKQLRKLRLKYFGSIRNKDIRALGIQKMRE